MYTHGGDIYSFDGNTLDFSANINPLGLHEEIKETLINRINGIENYPDVSCKRLRAAIADMEGVNASQVICGNGAADIIYSLVLALMPKKVLLMAPSFTEYERAADTIGAEKNFYYLQEKKGFCIDEDVPGFIDESVDMVFICNPNNPTGNMTDRKLLIEILDKCKKCGTFVLADECFMDFVNGGGGYSLLSFIEKYDNLMVLKAFTKMYAMPGIRLGYGISSNDDLLKRMSDIRQPWGVSYLAQEAGIKACELSDIPVKTREYVKNEREYLLKEISKLPFIKAFDAAANFILLKSEYPLYEKLIKENILIRKCDNFCGLTDKFYRIAVKKHEDNVRIIEALKKVTEDG